MLKHRLSVIAHFKLDILAMHRTRHGNGYTLVPVFVLWETEEREAVCGGSVAAALTYRALRSQTLPFATFSDSPHFLRHGVAIADFRSGAELWFLGIKYIL